MIAIPITIQKRQTEIDKTRQDRQTDSTSGQTTGCQSTIRSYMSRTVELTLLWVSTGDLPVKSNMPTSNSRKKNRKKPPQVEESLQLHIRNYSKANQDGRQDKKSFWENTNKAFVKWFICAEALVLRRVKKFIAGMKPNRLGQS